MTTFQSGMKFIWPLMCSDLSTWDNTIVFIFVIPFISISISITIPISMSIYSYLASSSIRFWSSSSSSASPPGLPPVLSRASIGSLVISSKMLFDLQRVDCDVHKSVTVMTIMIIFANDVNV